MTVDWWGEYSREATNLESRLFQRLGVPSARGTTPHQSLLRPKGHPARLIRAQEIAVTKILLLEQRAVYGNLFAGRGIEHAAVEQTSGQGERKS